MYDLLRLAGDSPTSIAPGSGVGIVVIAVLLILCSGGKKK